MGDTTAIRKWYMTVMIYLIYQDKSLSAKRLIGLSPQDVNITTLGVNIITNGTILY